MSIVYDKESTISCPHGPKGEPGDIGVPTNNKLRKQLNIENQKNLSNNLSIHFIFRNVKRNKRRKNNE